MGIFSKMKSSFSGSVQKVSGRKDFLEAVCAACALVAAADGEVEDAEVKSTIKTILANPTLSGSFDSRTIEMTADTMFTRAQSGRSGRLGLYKEIDDIASDPELAEIVYVTALDVSDSDGQMEPEEKKVLDNIASKLRIDASKYAEV